MIEKLKENMIEVLALVVSIIALVSGAYFQYKAVALASEQQSGILELQKVQLSETFERQKKSGERV